MRRRIHRIALGPMQTHSTQCVATTRDEHDIVDITPQIEAAVADGAIKDGQATVFSSDPACVVMMNECEAGLLVDIKATMKRLETRQPQEGRAMLGSTSVVIPICHGRLYLGQWQRILLVELGGGQSRDIVVQVMGD